MANDLRKIRFYKQSEGYTCGPACVLMILDHYRKILRSSPGNEMDIYRDYRSKAFMGMPGVSVAQCLADWGFQITLHHAQESYMLNRENYFEPILFESMRAEYVQRLEESAGLFEVRTGSPISSGWLRDLIAQEHQAILETIVPGSADGLHSHTLHWIVVYGYENRRFHCIDPAYGKLWLTEEELDGFLDTPIGKICVEIHGLRPIVHQK